MINVFLTNSSNTGWHHFPPVCLDGKAEREKRGKEGKRGVKRGKEGKRGEKGKNLEEMKGNE